MQKGSTSEIVVHEVRQHTCSTIIGGFNKYPMTTDKTRQLFCPEKLATFHPIIEAGNEALKNDSDKPLTKAVIKLKKILFTVI